MHVEKGLQKIADHITQSGADIVALQELMYPGLTNSLLQYLGSGWTGVERRAPQAKDWPGLGIVTKFKLDRTSGHQTNHSVGATVLVRKDPYPEVKFRIWSFHGNFSQYGPYNACRSEMGNEQKLKLLQRSEEFRISNIKQVLTAIDRQDISDQPVLILGDFNEPSHLDWIEETKEAHCGMAYDWPVSKLLLASGFKDAYRIVKPDPKLYPGVTWSTVQKLMEDNKTRSEPQDRIDFIYYRGDGIRPIDASVYSGSKLIAPLPHIDNNDWPSDHFSVISDFQLIV